MPPFIVLNHFTSLFLALALAVTAQRSETLIYTHFLSLFTRRSELYIEEELYVCLRVFDGFPANLCQENI